MTDIFKKPVFWIVVFAIIVCTLAGVYFLTNSEYGTLKQEKDRHTEEIADTGSLVMSQTADSDNSLPHNNQTDNSQAGFTGSYVDNMGSSLTIRKNADGSYVVDFGIYKFTFLENAAGTYDSQTNVLHFSGTVDGGSTLAADITADASGCLTVTLTESPSNTDSLGAGAVFSFWPCVNR